MSHQWPGVCGGDVYEFRYLDDLHQLIHSALPRKQRLSQQELSRHAPKAPRVNGARVVRGPEDELWCSVVSA